MYSDPVHHASEPDFSWIPEWYEKVFPTSNEPPRTPKLPKSMPDVNDFSVLLQTRKDGFDYTIFRRNGFEPTGTVDDSIITFCISTLESIQRMRKKKENLFLENAFPLVSSHLATDGVHDFVQIVAKKNECSTSSFLCWAEDGELVTGTAIVCMRCKEFPIQGSLALYGNFKETMRGNILPHYHLFAHAHDAGLDRFTMVSVFMRQQLALSSIDSINKPCGIERET
jgi:hypothetical protein